MYDVEQLFVEYTRRRKREIDPKEIIQELRRYIRNLPDADKQALKSRIRKWEVEYMMVPANTPAPPVETSHPAIRRITIEARDEEQEPELVETFCNFCGRVNRIGETVCHACGRLLDPMPQVSNSTRVLHQTSDLSYSDEYFGDDFVLSLKVRGSTATDRNNIYEIRPQELQGEVTIGRVAFGSETEPDIDLSEHGAEERGVSRLHVSLHYDYDDCVIRIQDRNSANGTFINGQRLHRNEVRVLRNGDELRLGKLVMSVKFYTYGFE